MIWLHIWERKLEGEKVPRQCLIGTFAPGSELAPGAKRLRISVLCHCSYHYFIGTDADLAASSSSRSSSARRQRLSGSRSGGTSRQPSEDDREEEAVVASGTGASATGEPHTGRHSRRTEGSSGRQLLSPSSVDDDESGQISPLQVNKKQFYQPGYCTLWGRPTIVEGLIFWATLFHQQVIEKEKNKIKQLYNTTQRNEKHRQTFVHIT